MNKFVAFLRAVNVGGRVVKMDELKQILAIPGITNITSYIQSGNILFDTKYTVKEATHKIEHTLVSNLGYKVTAFLKTNGDIEQIIGNNPYTDFSDKDLYITMLSDKPDRQLISSLDPLKSDGEEITIVNTEAYILCPPKTYGNTKLSNSNIEKKLKIDATTRNWATINKIAVLLGQTK